VYLSKNIGIDIAGPEFLYLARERAAALWNAAPPSSKWIAASIDIAAVA
jgi:hypothetical protein